MKTNLLSTVLLTATVLLFCQCSKADFDDFSNEAHLENIPEASKQFGLSVAKELNATIRNLHKQGVDYSNANETAEFKESFYNDFFKASPSAIKTKSSAPEVGISPEEFTRRVKSITKVQLDFIDRIIKECEASISYSDFYHVLTTINEDIRTSVPNIQQERLFNITSVLYYGMKEIQNLESQGLMVPTPQSNIQHLLVKTKSESGESFGETCRKILATTWAVALAEPTPVGEVVASVVTTGVVVVAAGVLLYEFIVCTKKVTVDCSAEYADCVNSGSLPSWKCYDCLRYCEGQNVWDCPRPY